MLNKNNQSGIATTAILVGLVLVAAVGGGGYYVYNRNTARTGSDTSATSMNTAPANKPAASQQYLTLDASHTRVKLTAETADLQATESTADGARFNLKSYLKESDSYLDKACRGLVSVAFKPASAQAELAADNIYPFKFDAAGKPLPNQAIIQLADKRYAIITPNNGACLDSRNVDSATAASRLKRYTDVKQLLVTSIKANLQAE